MSRKGRDPFKKTRVLSSDDEQIISSLTRTQLIELNSVFDDIAAGRKPGERPTKKRKLNTNAKGKSKGKQRADEPSYAADAGEQAPGGFLIDDDEPAPGGFLPEAATDTAGGFMPDTFDSGPLKQPTFVVGDTTDEDAQTEDDNAEYILLDQVSACLEALSLDGDDPSVLRALEHASETGDDGLPIVKRKEFFKVAALLIRQRDAEREEALDKVKSKGRTNNGKRQGNRAKADDDDSDALVLSSDDDDMDEDALSELSDPWADEDEVMAKSAGNMSPPSSRRNTRSQGPISDKTSPARRSKGKGKADVQNETDDAKYTDLNSKQKAECERMFQQFFASTDTSKNKAISASEIRYVATLLNEKLSDAEVGLVWLAPTQLTSALQLHEMLEYASTTRDKRVSKDAFARIMVDVKAV